MSTSSTVKRPASKYIVLDSEDEEFETTPPQTKPAATSSQPEIASNKPLDPPSAPIPSLKRKASSQQRVLSINDALMAKKTSPRPVSVDKQHSTSRHSVAPIVACRPKLLEWYNGVKAVRGMPWRKDYDASMSRDARTQRAYEVLVSEIMLQQTQM